MAVWGGVRRRNGRLGLCLGACGLGIAAGAFAAGAARADVAASPNDVEALRNLSIDQLGQIQVTSVSKSPQALSTAPSAIYVITHDEIVRSGAVTIPEMLRLAPNLQVMQFSASKYIITARGFSGNQSDQNFTNKLLVLIDGRTVYSPLFSGVYWDMQDVLPADIDRIEVISGPGATLWGANAVNGVINIITRKAADTQGALIDVGGGNQQVTLAAQYGGQVGPIAWRAYAQGFRNDDTLTATGSKAGDSWSRTQAGFRADWAVTSRDAGTLQGDYYDGANAIPGAPDEDIKGGNLLARWTHQGDASTLQAQAYYDFAERGISPTGAKFSVITWDAEVQDSFNLGPRNAVVVGAGVRLSHYHIFPGRNLFFAPTSSGFDLGDVFIQDTVALTRRLNLVVGLKGEDDPYTGFTLLPDVRLSWKPTDETLLWAAVSRAVRSATPFDRDVIEKVGPLVFLIGGSNFEPEKLVAYEIGARAELSRRFSVSVSAYYHQYDDLKSIELAPTGFLPLRWGNGMRGYTYGVEIWGDYQAAPWWRLHASFTDLEEHLGFEPGSSRLLGVAAAGDDPEFQVQLRSSMNLGPRVTWDAELRYQSALPNPSLPAYAELNTRLGWRLNDHVELSVSGFNLLHAYHLELPPSEGATAIPRSVFAELRWRF